MSTEPSTFANFARHQAAIEIERFRRLPKAFSANRRQENPQLKEDRSQHSIMLESLPHTFEIEPFPTNEELPVKAVATVPLVETESAVTRAQKAKSLLAELELNTAIRLRWVLRDIRSKRTKLSPVSDNDLTALMNLGLVEMREELPRLTALGVLALD